MLFDVYLIFDWAWHIHVVGVFHLVEKIFHHCFHIQNRYPDFLTRMQDYVNEPYTLCQVVSSRLTQSINSRSELGR